MELQQVKAADEILSLPVVIWAPNFDQNSGGCIVLHTLAYRLHQLGVEVYVSHNLPKQRKITSRKGVLGFGWIADLLRQANRNRLASRRGEPRPVQTIRSPHLVQTHPAMPVPSAPFLGGREFIAVYPEIIAGNPFDAPHVVRWLLFDPRTYGHDGSFGCNELTFFYQHAFAAGMDSIDPENLLQTRWLRDDIYKDHGAAGRDLRCRMIRKGDAADVPVGDTAILLDGKSHAEIASIFNKCDRFYCHDPYTMYLYYAALCGCTPVVVPQLNLTSESWREGFELKHGVAWGEDEADWAVATRDQLFTDMAAAQQTEIEGVRTFVGKIKARFQTHRIGE